MLHSTFLEKQKKNKKIQTFAGIILMLVIIKIHIIKRHISTKLMGENMFCMKAHQLYIEYPEKTT